MRRKVLPSVYGPKKVEKKWYSYWEDQGYFHPEVDKKKKPFTIVIPPPNVTGSLHMGHALNNVLQDVIVRQKRMEGYPTLWLPGTDHAGIATQNVVEQELAKEGKSRQDLGREKFLKKTWGWQEKYGHLIIDQLKSLGCSCDWPRTRFTLDESYSQAVKEAFVRMYKEGLIYRDNYLINWCPRCQTALSDIEVEHREIQTHLWYIKYPFEDGEGHLIVATTRPETLLGDTAVAINPRDKRYKKYLGKTLILPALGRKLPLITDEYIDPKFGTGVVKVTPAHDPNDFEMGKRQGLKEVNIFTPEAYINENGGKYQGLDRDACREVLLKDLKKQDLLEKTEDYVTAVGHCYRCDTIVEPYLSLQWFVKMKPLAKPAREVVKKERVKFFPKRWEKVYFEWLENIKDWCISRQIWWGHRLPVYYCKQGEVRSQKSRLRQGFGGQAKVKSNGCGEIIVSVEKPQKCPKCGSTNLEQEQDVLDTWFSSALWPFATLGWPKDTPDLNYFYPTTLLSTGFDIIYFWVARMIITGLYFLGEVPFKTVYIHALIRDIEGQKMSKSRGNVIDPLEVIGAYGTDALRFTLSSLAAPGRDIYLSEERIQGYRNFMNKIWNASRFILMNLNNFSSEFRVQSSERKSPNPEPLTPNQLELADRWILSRYNKVIAQVSEELEAFAFNKASKTLYDFFWGKFCDWYLELVKPRLYQQPRLRQGFGGQAAASRQSPAEKSERRTANDERRKTAQAILVAVLEGALRLIHPFAPFITEEIWQRLPKNQSGVRSQESGVKNKKSTTDYQLPADSIMVAPWPKSDQNLVDKKAEKEMALVQEITGAIRSLRQEFKIPPPRQIKVLIKISDPKKEQILRDNQAYIQQLASVSRLFLGKGLTKPHPSATAIAAGVEIFMPLEGIDLRGERKRLKEELEAAQREMAILKKKLSDQNFLKKAPEAIVKKEKEKARNLKEREEKLRFQLDQL